GLAGHGIAPSALEARCCKGLADGLWIGLTGLLESLGQHLEAHRVLERLMDHEVAVTLLKGVRELWREIIIAWRDRQDALGKISEPLLEIRYHVAASAADHGQGNVLLAHRADDLQPVVEVRAREDSLG